MITDLYSDLSPDERIEAIARVSMQDKGHLKRWLRATERTWMVFNAIELVDALRWPDGIDALMQIIACYRDHRASIPSGRSEVQVDSVSGKEVRVDLCKTETFEVEELDCVVRALIKRIKERKPEWNLGQPPL